MADLAVGDIVHLKSGSPDLTVMALNDDGYVDVTWFIEGHGYDETYPAAALTLARAPAQVHEIKRA